MTLEPLLQAPLAVQIHVATILPAFLLGSWLILISRKGARRHRRIGTLYLALMTVASVAALLSTRSIHKARSAFPGSTFSCR